MAPGVRGGRIDHDPVSQYIHKMIICHIYMIVQGMRFICASNDARLRGRSVAVQLGLVDLPVRALAVVVVVVVAAVPPLQLLHKATRIPSLHLDKTRELNCNIQHRPSTACSLDADYINGL